VTDISGAERIDYGILPADGLFDRACVESVTLNDPDTTCEMAERLRRSDKRGDFVSPLHSLFNHKPTDAAARTEYEYAAPTTSAAVNATPPTTIATIQRTRFTNGLTQRPRGASPPPDLSTDRRASCRTRS
jgi:hypothetical protein